MENSMSERIVDALQQLQQFMLFQPPENDRYALHVLTGVRVYPVSDPDEQDHQLILLKFPGGHDAEVIGSLYLELQIAESARHEADARGEPADSKSVAKRITELREHLYLKHNLG